MSVVNQDWDEVADNNDLISSSVKPTTKLEEVVSRTYQHAENLTIATQVPSTAESSIALTSTSTELDIGKKRKTYSCDQGLDQGHKKRRLESYNPIDVVLRNGSKDSIIAHHQSVQETQSSRIEDEHNTGENLSDRRELAQLQENSGSEYDGESEEEDAEEGEEEEEEEEWEDVWYSGDEAVLRGSRI